MDTAKAYKDANGDDCTIFQMVQREPYWAANRIQEGEKATAALAAANEENLQLTVGLAEFTVMQQCVKEVAEENERLVEALEKITQLDTRQAQSGSQAKFIAFKALEAPKGREN